ncbi:MAG: LytR/AlgR family response regulator transcription factor [Saprospiraceae bacterium]
MEKAKIQIVDDQLITANYIAELLEDNGYEITDICPDFKNAIISFQRDNPDLVILDINLDNAQNKDDGKQEEKNGIPFNTEGVEVAKIINQMSNAAIIYITGYSNVREIIKDTKAFFLTKPIREAELLNNIELLLANQKQTSLKEFIFVKDGYTRIRFFYKDILYIKADGMHSNIHTVQGKRHNLVMKLKDYEKNYPHPCFVRINRGEIINLNHIDSFDNNVLKVNGITIRMTRNQDIVKRYLMGEGDCGS